MFELLGKPRYLLVCLHNITCLIFTRQSNPFSFHTEAGQGPSKQVRVYRFYYACRNCNNNAKLLLEARLPFLWFFVTVGYTISCVQALSDADSKVSLIFKHQLMQLNNVSEHMAAAVVSIYPSPAHLLNVSDVQYCNVVFAEDLFCIHTLTAHLGPGSLAWLSQFSRAVLYYLFSTPYFWSPGLYFYQ